MFIYLLIDNVRVRLKNKKLALSVLQERIDKNIIIDKISKDLDKTKPIEQTDGFLKFISESRDLAFSYIEEAQTGISKFVKGVQPEIEYFSKFGSLSEGQPLHESMAIISKEYEELRKLIPLDYGKID
jgi:DNA-directed RNA polymerase beta' subunit